MNMTSSSRLKGAPIFAPRIVRLDEQLFRILTKTERDPLTAEIAANEWYMGRVLANPALAFAMIDGGHAAAAWGLNPMGTGVAECWALISEFARPRHIVRGVRFMKEFLDARQRDPMFRRVEIWVRDGEPWSLSFALAMDFVEEGFARARDPAGRDYRLFARIRELG